MYVWHPAVEPMQDIAKRTIYIFGLIIKYCFTTFRAHSEIMNKRGPIVVIEDDADDQHLLQLVFNELQYPNELVFLSDGEEALAYLGQTDIVPFIIISDVNLPKTGGFDLRSRVQSNEKLSLKCIPYIFFTTSADRTAVTRAYAMSVQGFFIKPHNYDELRETIRSIIGYWQKCYSPTSVFGKTGA